MDNAPQRQQADGLKPVENKHYFEPLMSQCIQALDARVLPSHAQFPYLV